MKKALDAVGLVFPTIRGFEDFEDTTPKSAVVRELATSLLGGGAPVAVLFVDDTAANVRDVAAKGPPGAQTLQAKRDGLDAAQCSMVEKWAGSCLRQMNSGRYLPGPIAQPSSFR